MFGWLKRRPTYQPLDFTDVSMEPDQRDIDLAVLHLGHWLVEEQHGDQTGHYFMADVHQKSFNEACARIPVDSERRNALSVALIRERGRFDGDSQTEIEERVQIQESLHQRCKDLRAQAVGQS